MKNSSTAAQVPAWRQQLHYRLKEGALIALGALCLILWMALLTYDQNDPRRVINYQEYGASYSVGVSYKF